MAFVSEGKSITTPRGVKGPGDKVEKDYFKDEKVFDELKQKGFITDNAPADAKNVINVPAEKASKPEAKPQEKPEAKKPENDPNVLPDNARPAKKSEKKSKK
jgi:hypothetical protein